MWGQSQLPSGLPGRRLGEERRLKRVKADEGHKKEAAWVEPRHQATQGLLCRSPQGAEPSLPVPTERLGLREPRFLSIHEAPPALLPG